MRISAGMGKFGDQVSVISVTHLPRFTPLYGAVGRGSALPVVCLLFDGTTARKMPYTPQDCANLHGSPLTAASRGTAAYARSAAVPVGSKRRVFFGAVFCLRTVTEWPLTSPIEA